MSKNDKYFNERMVGMAMALAVVVKATQNNLDPVATLINDIKFRKSNGVNIPTMTATEIAKESEEMTRTAIKAVEAIAIITLWEEHNFRYPALERFRKVYQRYTQNLLNMNYTWGDVIECLEAETGITFDRTGIFKMPGEEGDYYDREGKS